MNKSRLQKVSSIALFASILTIATASAQAPYRSVLNSRAALNDPVERVPLTDPVERLPVTDLPVDFSPPTPPHDRDRDVIIFAAGAVELTPPTGWQVREEAVGREMRLVITPPPTRNTPRAAFDSVWIVYQALPRDAVPLAQEISGFLETRMTNLIGRNGTVSAIKASVVQGWPGARQEFIVPASMNNPGGSRGFHVVIGTKWGFCEIHAESPTGLLAQRNGEIQELLRTFVLAEPQDRHVPTIAETRDAAAALGTWKAFRSRMKLFGDGRILIIQDAALDQPVDQVANPNEGEKHRLRGRFEARQDVLQVVWADGSKQNFRWRVQGNSLLLTDHDGQTNHLKRVYE